MISKMISASMWTELRVSTSRTLNNVRQLIITEARELNLETPEASRDGPAYFLRNRHASAMRVFISECKCEDYCTTHCHPCCSMRSMFRLMIIKAKTHIVDSSIAPLPSGVREDVWRASHHHEPHAEIIIMVIPCLLVTCPC